MTTLVRDARLATIVRTRDQLAPAARDHEHVRALVDDMNRRIDAYFLDTDVIHRHPHVLTVPPDAMDMTDTAATSSCPQQQCGDDCFKSHATDDDVVVVESASVAEWSAWTHTTNVLRVPRIGHAHAILDDCDRAVVAVCRLGDVCETLPPSERVRTPDDHELVDARTALLRAVTRTCTPVKSWWAPDAQCPVCLEVPDERLVIVPDCRVCDGLRDREHDWRCPMTTSGACVTCVAQWMHAQWTDAGRKLAAGVACPLCRGRFCEDDCVRIVDDETCV